MCLSFIRFTQVMSIQGTFRVVCCYFSIEQNNKVQNKGIFDGIFLCHLFLILNGNRKNTLEFVSTILKWTFDVLATSMEFHTKDTNSLFWIYWILWFCFIHQYGFWNDAKTFIRRKMKNILYFNVDWDESRKKNTQSLRNINQGKIIKYEEDSWFFLNPLFIKQLLLSNISKKKKT